jgi:acid phosphatase (class A)
MRRLIALAGAASILLVGLYQGDAFAQANPAQNRPAQAKPAQAKQRPVVDETSSVGTDWSQRLSLDWTQLVGAPPAIDSITAKLELERVRTATAIRSAAHEHFAVEDDRQTLVRFLEGMDIDVAKSDLRQARSLFRDANEALEDALQPLKKSVDRKRPFIQDSGLSVCPGKRPTSGSFPSSHAATGGLFGALLTVAVPELRTRIEGRASEYAFSRVVCGYHFQSDVDAGIRAGQAAAEALLADPAFRKQFELAKVELRKALAK